MSVSRDEPIRVVVVDDHQIVRDGLVAMLGPHTDVEVVGAAANAAEAIALVARTSPDVALVDINLGGESGLQLSRELIGSYPRTRVVCLTVHDEQQYLFEALRSGVSGFLLKRVVPEGLVAALRGVLAGETVVDPLLSGRVVKIAAESEARGTFWPGLQYGLTKREAELLELLTEGLPNKEVARHLCISEETVKSHLKSIYRKLSVSDRTEAVAVALREGLVPDTA